MSVSWVILIAATALQVVPLPLFYGRKRRLRTLQDLEIERRNGSYWTMLSHIFRFSGHWIELARGVLAAAAMMATIDVLAGVSPLYAAHAPWARLVLPAAAATLGVLVVALGYRNPGKALAPVAFVVGNVLVLVPAVVALPSLLLGLFLLWALRSLQLFFAATPLALAGLGWLLDRMFWPSLAGGVLAFLPLAVAHVRHQQFVIPVRRPASGA